MKNKSHQLKLNKTFYTKTAIATATASFAHLADFALDSNKTHYVLTISFEQGTDVDILTDEFANYVLYLMKNNHHEK